MVLHTDCKSVDLGFDPLLALFRTIEKGYSSMVESRTSNSSMHVRIMLPLTGPTTVVGGVNGNNRNMVSMVACRSPKSRGACSSQAIPGHHHRCI
jgi:hypothetical protein